MAAPVIAFTTQGAAYIGPVNKTPYMLRYEVQCTASGDAGFSNVLNIANDESTPGPNLFLDTLKGSPLQKEIAVTGLDNELAVIQLFTNPKLRLTFISTDPNIVYGAHASINGDGAPVLFINAIAALAGDPFTTVGYLTIEVRHSFEQ